MLFTVWWGLSMMKGVFFFLRKHLRREHCVIFLLVLGIVSEYVMFMKYGALHIGDNADIFFPQFSAAGVDGISTEWNRFAAAGTDRKTEGGSTLVNLWFYTTLPIWLAQQLTILAMVAAAVVGGYALCRRSLGLGFEASVFAGLACAALPYGMLVYNAQAWTPALIAALAFALERPFRAWRWALVLGAVFVLGETSYLSRILPWPSVAVVGWFLFVDRRRSFTDWSAILAVAIAVPALRLFELRDFLHIASFSHVGFVRWQASASEMVADALALSLFRGNWVYSLATILLMAGIGVAKRRGTGIGLATMVMAGLVGPAMAVSLQLALLEWIPQLYGYALGRLNILSLIALPFAGAWGMQKIQDRLEKQKLRTALSILCFGVLLATNIQQKIASARDWVSQGNYVQNFESPVLKSLAERIHAEGVPVRVENFQMYPTYLHAYGMETLGGYQPVFFRRYYLFWAKMVEPWAESLPPDHEAWGPAAKELVRRGGPAFRGDRLMLSPEDHRSDWPLDELYRLNLLSLGNVGWLVSRDRLHAPGLELVSGPAQTWSELSTRQKIEISARANFTGRDHLYVYRNNQVLPRFLSVERARVLPGADATLSAMAEASVEELATTAFFDAADVDGVVRDGQQFARHEIAVRRYGADQIELEVSGQGEGLVVVSNAYYPRWTVTVDGQPAALLAADYAFWGVRVPAGRHNVVFRYGAAH